MIQVRPAEARDGEALGEVHAASWNAVYAPLFQPDFTARAVESRRKCWHQRIAEGTGPILLAEVEDRLLALSFSVPSSRSGLAEIYSFYAHPDTWGSGVAATLMTETLSRLHDSGYAEVHLWTLRSTAQSHRFYTKCGFIASGAERTYDFGDGHSFDQLEYRRSVGSG